MRVLVHTLPVAVEVLVETVATLFQAQCTPAVVEENGEWKVMAKFNGAELPVSEALGQWWVS